jgi:hypothetical protein
MSVSNNKKISVTDLVAGPGGLGEGISVFRSAEKDDVFQIRLSIRIETSLRDRFNPYGLQPNSPHGKFNKGIYVLFQRSVSNTPGP